MLWPVQRKLKRTRVSCLEDIQQVVRDSTANNILRPQLVGNEDGTVIVPTYDLTNYLKDFNHPLSELKCYHFLVNSGEPGIIFDDFQKFSEMCCLKTMMSRITFSRVRYLTTSCVN